MADILEIARFAHPLYEVRTTLDEQDFIFLFDYVEREDRFYFSLFDTNNDPIYRGIKVVANQMLLPRCADNRRPKGEVMCVFDDDPGYTDWLGARLIYAEVEALEELITPLPQPPVFSVPE